MKWFNRSTPPAPERTEPQIEAKGLAEPSDDLFEVFGITPTKSGVFVSNSQALQVPAVTAAMRIISEAAASLDVAVKTVGEDGAETALAWHPSAAFVSGEANSWTSSYELIRDLVIDALSDDRGGLAFVNRSGDGRILEIIRPRAGVMQVAYDQITGEPSYRMQDKPVDASNVIHLRAPFGRAPLSLAREALSVAVALNDHASTLFANGARPSGVLSFPKGMGEDSVKKAIKAWRATHENGAGSGKTAILHDGAEFLPLAFSSTDSQFLEHRKFVILEIARAFRVPPTMLYDLDRATWSNGEQQGYEFLSYTLEPWLKALEAAFRRAIFSEDERATHVIRFDRDDLTRADLATRATAINSLIASRVLNPNEGRSWLDMQPYQGGETFINPNITQGNERNSAPAGEGEPNE
ncbi:phage portal protein [Thioclava sp. GXIMD4215]|uniref:phage portal protein n=1 Tax=Thioclava sp. GXIMD4215 TaxID=3131928 RepID=UPI00324AD34E